MFVYFHWPKNGAYNVQAFNKQDKAIEFVYNNIVNQTSYSNPWEKKKKSAGYGYVDAVLPRANRIENMFLPADQPVAVAPRVVPARPNFAGGDLMGGRVNLQPGDAIRAALDRAAGLVPQVPQQAAPAGFAVAEPPKEDKEEIVTELAILLHHLEVTKKEMTIENIRKAMELFDEYSKYILSNESLIHELNEIKITE